MQSTLGDKFGFEGVRPPKAPKSNKKWDKQVNKLLWAIQGPILCMPSWVMRPPKVIMDRIMIERMMLVMQDETMGSEAEAMWYISTSSMEAPLNHDWCNIYMYLTRKYLLSKGNELPDFLKEPIELAEYTQTYDLKRLRDWLFKKSYEEVVRRCKTETESISKKAAKETLLQKEINQQMDLSSISGSMEIAKPK